MKKTIRIFIGCALACITLCAALPSVTTASADNYTSYSNSTSTIETVSAATIVVVGSVAYLVSHAHTHS